MGVEKDKMALDKIPIVDFDVIDAHLDYRYRSTDEFHRFKSDVYAHLTNKNIALVGLIKMLACQSNDPGSVLRAAYTLLDVLNAQREADELNDRHELNYGGGIQ